jgi:protease stability complex PrcB-like protein
MSHETTKPRNKTFSGFRDFVFSWLILLALQIPMDAQIALRPIATGAQSGIASPRQAVIRTAAEWDALWRDHQASAPKPAVDFSKETVVAVFLGSRPTSGYEVAIVSAAEEGGVLRVRYRETRPPADAITAQVMTFPFQIVAIPASSAKDVKFEKAQ